ncbi:MAG: TetR/AcrR family transcriptional regulator [Clostridia bacterium]|nr:TetR/AcrR family transcriptional regulator [Clostridia bacterium]
MPKKSGRPKGNKTCDNRERITSSALELIKAEGAAELTVRKVCETADVSIGTFYHYFKNKDDLLMHFVRIISFDEIELIEPIENIPERICELYMHFINKYLSMGKNFMKGFYSTENKALSAYMGAENERFEEGTVMHRCEQELQLAIDTGILNPDCDAHLLSADICTIVKGIIFEWCLMDRDWDMEEILSRILHTYFRASLK